MPRTKYPRAKKQYIIINLSLVPKVVFLQFQPNPFTHKGRGFRVHYTESQGNPQPFPNKGRGFRVRYVEGRTHWVICPVPLWGVNELEITPQGEKPHVQPVKHLKDFSVGVHLPLLLTRMSTNRLFALVMATYSRFLSCSFCHSCLAYLEGRVFPRSRI